MSRRIPVEFLDAVHQCIDHIISHERLTKIAKALYTTPRLAVQRNNGVILIDNPHLNGQNIDTIHHTMKEIVK